MTLHTSPNSVLTRVARSLVASKRFATVEDALWDMAISTVRGRVILLPPPHPKNGEQIRDGFR
jgi:hypothetical protein